MMRSQSRSACSTGFPRRRGHTADTPKSRALAASFTLEYCEELLRMNPAGVGRLMDIALERKQNVRRKSSRAAALAQ